MARMSESTVREIEGATGALEFVVPLRTPHRMLVRVVNAHFPNAPSDMRWSLASSVRTRDQQGQSRTTFAGYPAKLRVDAREDEINTNSVPCVIDMALNAPWYNAIVLECESLGQPGAKCEPGRGWLVDLAFDPYEPRATTTTTAGATATAAPAPSSATAATAATNNAPVSVVVSVAQGTARTFMCPYCHTTTPYAYASQANLRRHITRCH
jgi:hypothetical protein